MRRVAKKVTGVLRRRGMEGGMEGEQTAGDTRSTEVGVLRGMSREKEKAE